MYSFTVHEDAWLRDGPVFAGGQVTGLPSRRNARRKHGKKPQDRLPKTLPLSSIFQKGPSQFPAAPIAEDAAEEPQNHAELAEPNKPLTVVGPKLRA